MKAKRLFLTFSSSSFFVSEKNIYNKVQEFENSLKKKNLIKKKQNFLVDKIFKESEKQNILSTP